MEHQRTCCGQIHTIKKGDTLYKIGREYQVSITSLLFVNPWVDIYHLQIGDELCIPIVKILKNEDRVD